MAFLVKSCCVFSHQKPCERAERDPEAKAAHTATPSASHTSLKPLATPLAKKTLESWLSTATPT